MPKFTNDSVREHIKLALSPSLNKSDHKKASNFLIEYYGEIFDSQSTHLKPTIIAFIVINLIALLIGFLSLLWLGYLFLLLVWRSVGFQLIARKYSVK
ncbi:hypothetical protein [Psychromonas sp. KJ10-2]|uniref:hypothetical protein n=1 Tax=Psychromonas sp. KJ10-2 TaxID=3391822 RepID=UPI0039B509D8